MAKRLKKKLNGDVVEVEDTKPKAKRKPKAKPKKKLKKLPALSEVAAKELQKLVRLKAADDNGYCECVTCNAVKHYKEMQGGHFIQRGKKPTKLLEENIHPQCAGCNGNGMKYHGKEKVYALYMIDMYGRGFVDQLIIDSNKAHKWVRHELNDLIIDLRKRVKVEESRVCGVAV